MKYLNCAICHSDKIYPFIPAKHINEERDVLKCQVCGLVFLSSAINDKLDDSYWNKKSQIEIYEENEIMDETEEEFKKRLQAIKELKNKGKLLDIGCGLGNFLSLAKQDGWDVIGIEVSHQAAEYARKKFALDIYESPIENCPIENGSIDVATMWDVIEHIQNPVEALMSINDKLEKGGALILKTPCEDSLFRIISRFIYRVSLHKLPFLLKYLYYAPHYFYYNQETIRTLLEKCGFDVIKIERDETNRSFAKEKIKLHYGKFFSKNLILLTLPIVYLFSRIFGLANKMIVYAVKEPNN